MPLDELSGIPARLTGDVKMIDLHREASIWDNWVVLGLLVFIYCLDVGLRRMGGLS